MSCHSCSDKNFRSHVTIRINSSSNNDGDGHLNNSRVMKKSIEILNSIAATEGNSPALKRTAKGLVMRIELAVQHKANLENDLASLKPAMESYLEQAADLVTDPSEIERIHLDMDNLMHNISKSKRHLIAMEYSIFHSNSEGVPCLLADVKQGACDKDVLVGVDLNALIRSDHGIGDMIDARLEKLND